MSIFRKLLLIVVLGLSIVAAAVAGPIDINSADANTLAETMKGVGLNKAQAIVAYRTQHGPFKSIDDLAQVKGIGEKTIKMNRSMLTVGNPAKQVATKKP